MEINLKEAKCIFSLLMYRESDHELTIEEFDLLEMLSKFLTGKW